MEPLTIKNFDASDSLISAPYLGNYGLMLAKFINVETHKSLPPIRIDGDFKVFINKNNDKKSFSLATSVDKTNEKFFERLEHSLSQLASAALPCTKPEDFKVINMRARTIITFIARSTAPQWIFLMLLLRVG